MPPRYAYWTIIVDDKPTAFRSGTQEELMPTFKRLKAKNDTAVMMWWQYGKLWPTRVDAQEMIRARGELGRRGDERQAGTGFRDRERKPASERTAWTPRGEPSTPTAPRNADDKLDWKPKGEFVPAPKRAERPERAEWKPRSDDRDSKPKSFEKRAYTPRGDARAPGSDWKSSAAKPRSFKADSSEKPAWKPKGSFDREDRPRSFKRPDFKASADDGAKPQWKPKGSFDRERAPKSDWKPRSSEKREWSSKPHGASAKPSRSEKPEWKAKGDFTPAPRRSEKPDWKSKSDDRDARPKSFEKRAWTPRGDERAPKSDWKPRPGEKREWSSKPHAASVKPSRFEKPEWKAKGDFTPAPRRSEKPEWKPKTSRPERPDWTPKSGHTDAQPSEKRKWVPKEEYKKSMGIVAKRDAKWRPGGEHKDPKQKFKDAKKAKWTKFKKDIRARSGGRSKKPS